MIDKYFCPKCGKELSEADIMRGVCAHCHRLFDTPEVQQVSSQKEQEKEQSETKEEEKDEIEEDEQEGLPSKTISKIQIAALFSFLIILLVSYSTVHKIIKEKKKQEEILLVQKSGKIDEELEKVKQTKKEIEKSLEQSRLDAQKEKEKKKQEEILSAQKSEEIDKELEKVKQTKKEIEKSLEQSRLDAQKEKEKQFQHYYDEGERTFQDGDYVEAIEFYLKALAYNPIDSKTQEKINLTIAKIKQEKKEKEKTEELKKKTEEAIAKAEKTITKTEEVPNLAKKKEPEIRTEATEKIEIDLLSKLRTKVFVPGKGFDIIQPEDNLEKILKIFGKPETTRSFGARTQIIYHSKYHMDFLVDEESGNIREIHFNEGFEGHLENGIRIGDSLKKVLREYGGPFKTVKASEIHGVKFGPDKVLYEQVISGEITAYKFINAREGVLFWFGRDEKLIQIIVFKPFRG